MKNNITELVFILDKSGSMSGLESDTVGGFNSMIERQKELDGKCYVSTVLFSDDSTLIHDRAELQSVAPMTARDYRVGGCTALIDAIGDTIHRIAMVHHYARAEDVPERTVFIITTDGMENASRRYSAETVRSMIRKEQEKYGWEFLFLGANIDAVETAANFGIPATQARNYRASAKGTAALYECVNEAVSYHRAGAPLPSEWGNDLDK